MWPFNKKVRYAVRSPGWSALRKKHVEKLHEKLLEADFPLNIEVVKHADDPLHSVSKGCLIAASILED